MAKSSRFSFVEDEVLDEKNGNGKFGLLIIAVLAIAFLVFVASSGKEKPVEMKKPMETEKPVMLTEPALTTTAPELTEPEVGTDVLAQYSSPNYGGYDRTINLELSCAAINGTEVAPGEIFSFNQVVGERTEEKGYKPAAVYTSGDTVDEIGGGICQIASTLYLVAMKADMKIVERSCHSYTVSYLPLGMDAAIYWDNNDDFRFQNTSKYPIRILASVEEGFVNISIEGTKEDSGYILIDYEVLDVIKAEEKIEIAWLEDSDYYKVKTEPHDGYHVQTYRCYYDADGFEIKRVKEDTSYYYKRDKVVVTGPPKTE